MYLQFTPIIAFNYTMPWSIRNELIISEWISSNIAIDMNL